MADTPRLTIRCEYPDESSPPRCPMSWLGAQLTRQMKPDDVSAKFAEMATTGRIPAGAAATDFWSLTLSHADQKEDAELYEKALAALKKMHGDNPRNAEIFARYDQRLKELRGG